MLEFMSPEAFQITVMLFVFILATALGALPLGAFLRRLNMKVDSRSRKTTRFSLIYLLSLSLDAFKGAAVIAMSQGRAVSHIAEWLGFNGSQDFHLSLSSVWFAGLCALVGHTLTPWRYLREGNGISTLFGVGMMLSPVSTLIGIVGAGLAYLYKKGLAITSITGLILASVTYLVLYPIGSHVVVGVFYLYFVLAQFESYIDSLIEG